MTLKELERLAKLNARYAEMAYDLGQETGRNADALKTVTHCISDLVDDMTEFTKEYGDDVQITDTVKMYLATCLECQIKLIEMIYTA